MLSPMLKVEPTLPRNRCSSARTCKYFAKSVRMGINHIKQRQASDDGGIFFCSAYACVCVCEGGGWRVYSAHSAYDYYHYY